MARRPNSLRKSANDMMQEESPFKTMYSQQFVDPQQRMAKSKTGAKMNNATPSKVQKQSMSQLYQDFTPDGKR